jgi:hypothetical protein
MIKNPEILRETDKAIHIRPHEFNLIPLFFKWHLPESKGGYRDCQFVVVRDG